jgi:hypothetical protein
MADAAVCAAIAELQAARQALAAVDRPTGADYENAERAGQPEDEDAPQPT